jgi:hypothetical protein
MRLREWFGTGWMPRKGRRSREVLAGTILFPIIWLHLERWIGVAFWGRRYASGSSSHKAGNIGKLKPR